MEEARPVQEGENIGYLEVQGSGSCAEMDRDVALPEVMVMGRQDHSGPGSHQLGFPVFKL